MKHTIALFTHCLMIFMLGYTLSSTAQSQNEPNPLLEINKVLETQSDAWNKGDAAAYSHNISSQVSFTNILGMHFVGSQAFLERHQQVFNGPFRNTKFKQELVSITMLSSDVAIVETLVSVSGFTNTSPLPGITLNKNGELQTRLLQVLMKQDGQWIIEAYHNTAVLNNP